MGMHPHVRPVAPDALVYRMLVYQRRVAGRHAVRETARQLGCSRQHVRDVEREIEADLACLIMSPSVQPALRETAHSTLHTLNPAPIVHVHNRPDDIITKPRAGIAHRYPPAIHTFAWWYAAAMTTCLVVTLVKVPAMVVVVPAVLGMWHVAATAEAQN